MGRSRASQLLVVLDAKKRPCPSRELNLASCRGEVTHSHDAREFGVDPVDPALYLL